MARMVKSIDCDNCSAQYDVIFDGTPYEDTVNYCSFCGEELDIDDSWDEEEDEE